MKDDNKNSFRPYKQVEPSQTPNQSNTQKFQPRVSTEHQSPSSSLNGSHRKDIFVMSFFGVLAAGVVILLILLITGVLTGYVSLDIDLPDLSGEEEVIPEEAPVIPVVENVTETVVEEVVEEEEEVLPCEQDITLNMNDGERYGLKVITLKLVSDYSAQLSVGGKSEFMDVGDTTTINGLRISLIDTSESTETATIQVAC